MKRVLILLVSLFGLTVARPAQAKPSIAVLGLEVVEESDTPDAKAAQYAEALTDALRARARLSSGPFTLAAGSDKSLVEMKLLSGCDNEANPCMAGIGTELAADRLVFGHIQKNGANYQISLKLLNVATKSIERTTSDLAAELTARLGRFVPEPSVTVMVHEVRAPRVFVLGEVAHPGAFPLAAGGVESGVVGLLAR